MSPAIHIVILAWQRYAYTFETLDSLWLKNFAFRGLHVWHALEHGHHPMLPGLFKGFGVPCLARAERPAGIAGMFEAALEAMACIASADDLVLVLENDWHSVRPIPITPIRSLLQRGIDAVWLFERRQMRMGRDGRLGGPPIQWHQIDHMGERWRLGRAWWGHPPTVSRLGFALDLVRGASTGADSRLRSVEMGCRVAWPVEPVFTHIGKLSYKGLGGKR